MIVAIARAADILQGSCNMEDPLPSKCASAVGSDDGGKALCNGFGMDGQWKYQRIRQGTQGCEPVRTRRVLLPLLAPPVTDEIAPGSSRVSPGGCCICIARG